MNKYASEYKIAYPKVIGAAILSMIMSGYLMTRSEKPRENFIHQKGTISYLSPIHPLKLQSASRPKDIYLILNEYERVFELFIGTDKGDFSPRINRLTELKIGDRIDIYFEETNKTITQPVNRLLQYLDKNGEPYYLRSKVDKYLGYFILGCSGLLLILGIYVRRKSN